MIYAAEWILNKIMFIFFSIILLYGIYAVWDSVQIDHQADISKYKMYRPDDKNSISFEKLQKMNPEVFGWITIFKTHIDYPLVQAENNHKYINMDAEGKFSLSGSIFLDCRNKKDFSDVNNIIYGHHMRNSTMFGQMEKFKDKNFFEENKFITLTTENEVYEYEIFAIGVYDADFGYNKVSFTDKNDFNNFLNKILTKSMYSRNIVSENDKIITLSTCSFEFNDARLVVHGKLIKN